MTERVWNTNTILSIISGANALSKKVKTMLVLYRKHVNSWNNITIPKDDFFVQIKGFDDFGRLKFRIINVENHSWESTSSRPVYDLCSWGGATDDDILYYEDETHYHSKSTWKDVELNFPLAFLEYDEQWFINKATELKSEKLEQERLKKIASLKEELTKLEKTNVS